MTRINLKKPSFTSNFIIFCFIFVLYVVNLRPKLFIIIILDANQFERRNFTKSWKFHAK